MLAQALDSQSRYTEQPQAYTFCPAMAPVSARAVMLAVMALLLLQSEASLMMPTCTERTPTGECADADDDGASLLQLGNVFRLKEPPQEELLMAEDDEEG